MSWRTGVSKIGCSVVWAVGVGLPLGVVVTSAQQPLAVIPAPLKVEAAQGAATIASGAVVEYPRGDKAAKFDAEHLAELVKRTVGLSLDTRAGHAGQAVILLERTGSGGEGYDLVVADGHVVISAKDDAGLYYGTVTLWQMMSAHKRPLKAVTLEGVKIHDAPQMKWRGLMLDSARHMQSIEFIQQLVDWMSLEKLNTLHWHLTDDQGWRLEIKRYPKLTSVGGYRELASEEGATDPTTEKSYPKYGGYYTQDQVRALVAYAAERNVTIVPEIEMPGHASAALAAYPEFGVAGAEKLTAPANHYGVFPSLYNVNDETFDFI